MNGSALNLILMTLVGLMAISYRMTQVVGRLEGYVHENHAIGRRLESAALTTNSRLSKAELKAAEQKGSIGAIAWMARAALAMLTLGVAFAGLVLLKV